MAKFSAKDCKNFTSSSAYTINDDGAVVNNCVTQNCTDRKDCDWEITEEIPEVHFEAKEEP